ncbi:MAG: arsenate reductase [Planctomycetota bacterium]
MSGTEAKALPRVLFLCTGNSCRSQMAEGWLRHLAGDKLIALSAGTEAHGLNPEMLLSMDAAGLDLRGQRSETMQSYMADPPEVVISVCAAAAESCPVLPARTAQMHWPFEDPAGASGSAEEIAAVFAGVRDVIRARIESWLADGAPLPQGGALFDCA